VLNFSVLETYNMVDMFNPLSTVLGIGPRPIADCSCDRMAEEQHTTGVEVTKMAGKIYL